jgi:predicted transcriptional regulator
MSDFTCRYDQTFYESRSADKNVNAHAQRRSRMDIISGILEFAKNGEKKTRIMYRATLSYKQMQRYLPLLISGGLLEEVEKPNRHTIYKTTKRGLGVLKKIQELNSL